MSKRKLSRQQQWRIEKVQAERTKRAEKRETQDRDKLDAGEYGPEQHGRVIAHYGRSLEVESESGSLHRCHLRANLETLVTGDRVIWREASDASGVVVARGARTTELDVLRVQLVPSQFFFLVLALGRQSTAHGIRIA